jgi:hypothetical protein
MSSTSASKDAEWNDRLGEESAQAAMSLISVTPACGAALRIYRVRAYRQAMRVLQLLTLR